MFFRRILTGLVAAAMLLVGPSCGRTHRSDVPSAVPARSNAPSTGKANTARTLDSILHEIDTYPVPKGVSPDAWGKLTSELKRLLVARAAGGKTISTAPAWSQNAVSDLAGVENGWGTETMVTWTEVLQGDYNNDGSVDVGDLAPVAEFYMQTTDSGPADGHMLIVGDPDPEINIADLQPIAANYGAHLEGYQVWRGHFNGTTTEWETAIRPNLTASHTEWSKDRATGPYIPVSSRPTYRYDDDVTQVTDKDNIRYKVVAYGDGEAGAESNEAVVPPLSSYVVSGTVLEGANPLPGVAMTLTPGPLTATTQTDGTFSISGVHYGNYTLTPAKMGVGFTPASRTVVVFGADVPGQDFTAAQPHTISGTIQESGTGLGGVVVTLTPGPLTVTTQPDGTYSIADVAYGTYTLVPRNLQYAFTPPARSVVVTSADVSGQDFAGVGGLPALAWPKFRGNLKNTGLSPYVGAQTGNLLWTGYVGGYIDGSSPVIGPDGTIYVSSYQDYHVLAFSPSDGGLKWIFQATAPIVSTPAVSADGTVYVGVTNTDRRMYALNPLDGSVKWQHRFSGGTSSSAAVGPDGTIYVGSDDGCVYALSPFDGTVVRTYATGSDMYACPAISDDGTLYVGCDNGKVYAFNVADGTQKWTFQTGDVISSSLAISVDGSVFVGSLDKNVYALNASDGSLKWQFPTGDMVGSSPAIGPDGTVYIGSCDGNLYALDHVDGSLKWAYASGPDWVNSSPAVGADDTVYFCANNYVYALNGPDGSLKWSYYTDATYCSPAIGADGTVYATAGTNIGRVHAFFP